MRYLLLVVLCSGLAICSATDRAWRVSTIYEDSNQDPTQEMWLNTDQTDFYYSSANPDRVDSLSATWYDWNENTFYHAWSAIFTNNTDIGVSQWVQVPMYDQPNFELKAVMSYDTSHRLINIAWWQVNSLHPNLQYLRRRLSVVYNGADIAAVHDFYLDQNTDERYRRYTYTTDPQGRVGSVTMSISPDSISWTDDRRFDISYMPDDTSTMAGFIQNFKEQATHHVWWLLPTSGLYYYSYGNVDAVTIYAWVDWDPLDWYLLNRWFYVYDAQGDLQSLSYDYWDSTQGWDPGYIYYYAYDNNNCQSQILELRDYDQGMIRRWRFEWESYTENDDELAPPPGFEASPNPFREELRIKLKAVSPADITIYNVKGQKLYSTSLSSGQEFTWQGQDQAGMPLPSGIYLISVRQKGLVTTGKVMLLK